MTAFSTKRQDEGTFHTRQKEEQGRKVIAALSEEVIGTASSSPTKSLLSKKLGKHLEASACSNKLELLGRFWRWRKTVGKIKTITAAGGELVWEPSLKTPSFFLCLCNRYPDRNCAGVDWVVPCVRASEDLWQEKQDQYVYHLMYILSCSPFYRSVRWTDGRWRKDCQERLLLSPSTVNRSRNLVCQMESAREINNGGSCLASVLSLLCNYSVAQSPMIRSKDSHPSVEQTINSSKCMLRDLRFTNFFGYL